MKKNHLIIIVSIIVSSLILAGGILVVLFNSNYYYSKKLVSAIKEENIIAVQQIIERNPDCINTYPSITSKWWQSAMNWRICYPLNEACGTGNLELIILLLENGANPNCNDGLTPLSITYSAKGENWYEISLILIEHGASLDYTTEYSGGKASVLQDIVKNRPSASVTDHVSENSEEVILAFQYAVDNCDHSKVNWMRVLQHSVSNDRIEITKFLLDNGYCDVNDTSVGMTALMFAARDSTKEMVQLLLNSGADKDIQSTSGKTAYDYAVDHGHQDLALLLKPNN